MAVLTLFPVLGLGWALLGAAMACRNALRRDRARQGFLFVTAVFSWPLGIELLSLSPAASELPIRALLGFRAVSFLFGPALYGYAGLVMRFRVSSIRTRWIHLLPFFLVILVELVLPIGRSWPAGPPGNHRSGIGTILMGVANAASVICYGVATYLRVRRFGRDREDFYASDRSSITLRWLGALAIADLAIFGGAILVLAIVPFVPTLPSILPESILNPAIACFLFVFVVFAHDQKRLDVYDGDKEHSGVMAGSDPQKDNPLSDTTTAEPGEPSSRYARSALTSDKLEILFSELEDYMRHRRPYLDADLDLDYVARDMGYTRHEISQAINTKTGDNFYAYINRYRIDAFLGILGENRERRIPFTTLAYECGFSSPSSFYSAVKRFTGVTPKQLASRLGPTPSDRASESPGQ